MAERNSESAKPAMGSRLSDLPITCLKGAGPRVADRFRAIGVHSIQDLLFHLPYRYQDRTRITSIGSLRPGDEALVCGEIELSQIRFGKRRSLVSSIFDGTGRLGLRLFHFSEAQRRGLVRGKRVVCFGEARRGPHGLEMVHPEYRLVDADQPPPLEPHLTPVYPATEGLNQGTIRRLMPQALDLLQSDGNLDELLPENIRRRLKFPPLRDAVIEAHRPPKGVVETGGLIARRRLAFEELLAHQLSLRLLRRTLDKKPAPRLSSSGPLVSRFIESLPFEMTAAQRRVVGEIQSDLKKPHPMHRLVQGDVGCGKTVVAAVAAVQTIESGYQAALMAPTELLAEQHLGNFRQWFGPLDLRIAWLTGKQT
ncbi:MAG TPA: DEAD/DEAH box helicase, partial [Gammaproteobacteria bacterium]